MGRRKKRVLARASMRGCTYEIVRVQTGAGGVHEVVGRSTLLQLVMRKNSPPKFAFIAIRNIPSHLPVTSTSSQMPVGH